jgi:hypothetical protein
MGVRWLVQALTHKYWLLACRFPYCIYDFSPAQSVWIGWLLWWALLAPAFVLVLALVLALYEDLGPQRPRRLLWYHLSPLLGAGVVSVITWSGAWFITAGC